jgi:hypothetical protein
MIDTNRLLQKMSHTPQDPIRKSQIIGLFPIRCQKNLVTIQQLFIKMAKSPFCSFPIFRELLGFLPLKQGPAEQLQNL